MSRFALALAACLGAAVPGPAQTSAYIASNTRGAVILNGTNEGAYTASSTSNPAQSESFLNFQNITIDTTDLNAPISLPGGMKLSELTLPPQLFDHTLPDGSYSINPVTPPTDGSTVITTPLVWTSYQPDPRVSTSDTVPFTVPRFELPDVTVKGTLTTDLSTGLYTFKYNASATGTDYLTGKAGDDTLSISGTRTELANHGWSDSNTFAFKNLSTGLLETGKASTSISPVPEPASVLAVGAAGLAAFRLRRSRRTTG